jgi:hypothetical protein
MYAAMAVFAMKEVLPVAGAHEIRVTVKQGGFITKEVTGHTPQPTLSLQPKEF